MEKHLFRYNLHKIFFLGENSTFNCQVLSSKGRHSVLICFYHNFSIFCPSNNASFLCNFYNLPEHKSLWKNGRMFFTKKICKITGSSSYKKEKILYKYLFMLFINLFLLIIIFTDIDMKQTVFSSFEHMLI